MTGLVPALHVFYGSMDEDAAGTKAGHG